ncbi:iron-sulfur cluster assembly accessory protein [bacterium]|nr:iron-sulfur cluster assembly accessory protein [bacterium]MCI0602472.1 iron-sulfur cluster assembly accessory protein [bacterium]
MAQIDIQISDTAATQIKHVLATKNLQNYGLRMGVKGGGCSGLTYDINFENETRAGDKIAEINGVKVFIDFKSYLYLRGTILEFSTDPLNGGFAFRNPNAKKTCGCGTSFSV